MAQTTRTALGGPRGVIASPFSKPLSSSNPSNSDEPTIYALSTAPGRSAIAIIRTSGPLSTHIYHALCHYKPLPQPRHAVVRTLYDPSQFQSRDTILDPSALVLYFPAPNTFTGEDILELHVHGGPAVVKAVLSAISRIPSTGSSSIRYAQPGEFTLRAFHNSRLTLTQIEALSDTLAAETEQQRRLSIRGSTSTLPALYESWRQVLLSARGELEALIDFSEDQHFNESTAELCASISAQVQHLISLLKVHVQNAVKGELLRNGISVAFLGVPNAGKSSLLNCIVGREAAIVAEEAGTTRDVVDVSVDLGGWLVKFGDTAGVRKGEDGKAKVGKVEEEGIRRAKARAAESDVVVMVLDLERRAATGTDGQSGEVALRIDPDLQTFIHGLACYPISILVAINKSDLISSSNDRDRILNSAREAFPAIPFDSFHFISCKHAEVTPSMSRSSPNKSNTTSASTDSGGIQYLLSGLTTQFANLTTAIVPSSNHETPGSIDQSIYTESLGASQRHRDLLSTCLSSLEDFEAELQPQQITAGKGEDDSDGGEGFEPDIVLAAEHLRRAAESLARITGKGEGSGDVEEVLGVVFEKFCVGK
ncbi:tRNA modification GTPase like protein [Zymoseptoria brevis]|uniref:tRNA modification GTPase like protein n=1 Tax=Zymoseptoria brevis TaxID=1047168 RepID=A0A0F4GY95_9PEZI|nr:tRNA modification GTPase like protein [Zymoseptoria brevis]